MNSNGDIVDLSSDDDAEIEIVSFSRPYNKSDEDVNSRLEFGNVKDPYLLKFIKTCLKMEHSKGMLRVINRSVLALYLDANPEYLKSMEFKDFLHRTVTLIENSPQFKFSYIKSLCENLRRNKKKKRVSLITLDSSVKRNKKPKTEVIDVDNMSDCTEENEVIVLDAEKENQLSDNNVAHMDRNEAMSFDESTGSHENRLLIAQRIEIGNGDDIVKSKIKSIEDEIALLKQSIERLEQAEVDDDSINSPYVKSEMLKKKVVDLYKELCKLTDSPSVKRHKIHLRVLEGHPEAPVRILESFLNKNMQSNGYPLFPDFNDVKICVVLANNMCNLKWDALKVMEEARALFIQCGRALQKLRKEREWGDLLAQVKHEQCDNDPAENDPELMAKLEANKLTAEKNESDIITRYAQMETEKQKRNKKCTTEVPMDVIEEPSEEIRIEKSKSESDSSDCDSDSVILCEDMNNITNDDFLKNLIPHIKLERSNNNSGDKNKTNEIIDNNEELGTMNIKQEIDIKREPLSKLLEDLGDNYTTTIVDIEDPFLIVEISSDSSDDDAEIL